MMMRYGWILMVAMLAACGDSATEPPPPPSLSTAVHTEATSSWGNGISAADVRWRLTELTEWGVRGSYEATWSNATSQAVAVSYHLRFYDGSLLQVDKYPSIRSMQTAVATGAARSVTGNFTLTNVHTVAVANAVARMEIWASFEFEP